jgi:hypothetical protein
MLTKTVVHCILQLALFAQAELPAPFHEASADTNDGVRLRVHPPTVDVGGSFSIECEWWTAQHGVFYNATLSENRELPAQIVITSVDGKLRREMLGLRIGGSEPSTEREWTFLRSGQAVGKHLIVLVAKDSGANVSERRQIRIVDLPPGEYWVQAYYNHRLIEGGITGLGPDGLGIEQYRESVAPTDKQHMIAKLDRALAISKPVKLVVVDRSVNDNDLRGSPECPGRTRYFDPRWNPRSHGSQVNKRLRQNG